MLCCCCTKKSEIVHCVQNTEHFPTLLEQKPAGELAKLLYVNSETFQNMKNRQNELYTKVKLNVALYIY